MISHFNSIYTLGREVKIGYGNEGNEQVQIFRCDGSFFSSGQSIPEVVEWKEWKGRSVPILFGSGSNEFITEKDGVLTVESDIIAGAFYFLSGWQEHYSEKRDRHGRFPYEASIQKKLGIATFPVVNYYFDVLRTAVEKAYGISLSPRKPNGHAFGLCLTHDVDHCESAWKIAGIDAVKRGDVFTPWKLVFRKLLGRDVWFNFEEVMSEEEALGAHSTFFFIPARGKQNGYPNADYDITSGKMRAVMSEMQRRGFEVALHGSFGSHENSGQLREEKSKLPAVVAGNRFHFLKWDATKSGEAIESAGLDYDSTLGFAGHVGFRHAYCHPFRPFNLAENRPFNFLEIPLNVMDTTYWLKNYMGLDLSEMPASLDEVRSEVECFGGCMTLLWHNNTFSPYKFSGWKGVYLEFLQHCKQKNAGFFTAKEICEMYAGLMQSK